jgi:hypothetical protein
LNFSPIIVYHPWFFKTVFVEIWFKIFEDEKIKVKKAIRALERKLIE